MILDGKKILLMSFVLLFSSLSLAEEADEFPRSGEELKDSTAGLNELVNESIQKFVDKMNSKGGFSCQKERLMKDLSGFFGKDFSEVANRLRNEDKSDKIFYKPFLQRSSIYKDISMNTGFASTIVIKGTKVGIDKIDHFFNGGFSLYQEQYASPKYTDEQLLQLGTAQEHGSLGLGLTGVKSYGDMSANWAGYNYVKGFVDGPAPVLFCDPVKNTLTVRKKFDIQEHFTIAWSEAYNCSSFRDAAMANQVGANLRRYNLKCPIDAGACEKLEQIYKKGTAVHNHLVSLKCREPQSAVQVEQASEVPWWRALELGVTAPTSSQVDYLKNAVERTLGQ